MKVYWIPKTLDTMKKSFYLTLLGLMLAITLQAQYAKPLRDQHYACRNNGAISLGVTGGYGANDMVYSAIRSSKLRPWLAPIFGLAMEWNTMRRVSIGLDALYAMRGTHEILTSEFLTSFTTTAMTTVDYTMRMNGIEFRLPITYYLGYGENYRPYLFVAPRLDVWMKGDLRWERSYSDHLYPTVTYQCDLDQATVAPFDLSAMAGIGLCGKFMPKRTRFFVKAELAYGISVLSNFSSLEKQEKAVFQGWGDILHETLGTRRLQNIEARLTILLPLRKHLKDACVIKQ